MLKRTLSAVGAPILLAGTLLGGGAAFQSPKQPVSVASDTITFYGDVLLLPTAAKPSIFVITQAKRGPGIETPCNLSSDGEQTPVTCTGTSHGTIKNGVFAGSTTVASADGVIQFTGSIPIGGRASLTSCKEIDTDGTVTTGCTLGGSASLFTDGTGTHIFAQYTVNEIPGPKDKD